MPELFDPIELRGVTIRNRIVMPPMTSRLAAPDGTVTPELIRYYGRRAEGGTGLVTTEMCSPHPAGRHRARELGISDDIFVPGLRQLTDHLGSLGARSAVQIGHAGGHTREDITGFPPLAPSAIEHVVQEGDTRVIVPEALTADGIRALVGAFARAVGRARRAGFDVIELHGAHGYLIAQFLSPLDNRRTDAYGGALANRARFALEIIEASRREAHNVPLVFRLSADEFAPGGFTLEEAKQLARWAVEAGADAIHVSAGCYRSLPSGAIMAPPMSSPPGVFLELAAAIKKTVRVPVIAVGRLHDPRLAARVIRDGVADMIAIGRQLIADPDWPRKVREGRADEIRPCISCNTCIDGMREGSSIGCLVNPSAGRELERGEPVAAAVSRRIVVVGGGPAGMESARILAARGHQVTLLERDARLGGRLRLAAKAPKFQYVDAHEPTILKFVDFLAAELARLKVDVRTGVTATADVVNAIAPDVVIVATGARYRFPFDVLIPRLLTASPRWRRLLGRSAPAWLLDSAIRRPDSHLARRLAARGLDIRRIGDCHTPGRTPAAMAEASVVARQL